MNMNEADWTPCLAPQSISTDNGHACLMNACNVQAERLFSSVRTICRELTMGDV